MDKELKDKSTIVFLQRKAEADGHVKMLKRLREDKIKEHTDQLAAIDLNIQHEEARLTEATNLLTKLAAE